MSLTASAWSWNRLLYGARIYKRLGKHRFGVAIAKGSCRMIDRTRKAVLLGSRIYVDDDKLIDD